MSPNALPSSDLHHPGEIFTQISQSFVPGTEAIVTAPSVWPHPNGWVAQARTAQGSFIHPVEIFLCFPGLGVHPHEPQEGFSASPCLPRQCQHCVWHGSLCSVQNCLSPCSAVSLSLSTYGQSRWTHPKPLLLQPGLGGGGGREDSDPVPALL